MIASSPSGPPKELRLDALEMGILWPVVYASIFSAPVRKADLHSRIVGLRTTEEEMTRAMQGTRLRELLCDEAGLVWLRDLSAADMVAKAMARSRATDSLLSRHEAILDFIRRLSGVRFAALSGGCAHGAADDGDIDIFVVTRAGALWRTLLFATLTAKMRGWRRVLCMNYLVDETAQALPWRDFYAGFELISLKPLTGEAGHLELLRENPWVEPMFPNFPPSRSHGENRAHKKSSSLSRTPPLEVAARMIQRPYLRYRLPKTSGVELSDHAIRLHALDHRPRLRGLFQDALLRIGMEAPPWI